MLKVVGHRLMIDPDPVELEHKIAGGPSIILAKDERLYREATGSGTVVQIGPTAFVGFADSSPWCAVGDRIIYARHAGKFVEDPEEIDPKTKRPKEYYIINDEDVQVIIQKKEETKDE